MTGTTYPIILPSYVSQKTTVQKYVGRLKNKTCLLPVTDPSKMKWWHLDFRLDRQESPIPSLDTLHAPIYGDPSSLYTEIHGVKSLIISLNHILRNIPKIDAPIFHSVIDNERTIKIVNTHRTEYQEEQDLSPNFSLGLQVKNYKRKPPVAHGNG